MPESTVITRAITPNRIILDKKIVDNDVALLADDNELPASGRVAISLARLQADPALLQRGNVGVWLKPDDDPALLAATLAGNWSALALIAVQFPQFTDGRGYSIAYQLRTRLHYTGELRATGDVLRDQMFYMARCGFNAFAVREDKSIDDALTAFNDFRYSYQGSAEMATPLFRQEALPHS